MNTLKEDLDIEMDKEIEEIFKKMPSCCQLDCCGFGCIEWNKEIFEKIDIINKQEKLKEWIERSLEMINGKSNIRYINSTRSGFWGGDVASSVRLFNEIRQLL